MPNGRNRSFMGRRGFNDRPNLNVPPRLSNQQPQQQQQHQQCCRHHQQHIQGLEHKNSSVSENRPLPISVILSLFGIFNNIRTIPNGRRMPFENPTNVERIMQLRIMVVMVSILRLLLLPSCNHNIDDNDDYYHHHLRGSVPNVFIASWNNCIRKR